VDDPADEGEKKKGREEKGRRGLMHGIGLPELQNRPTVLQVKKRKEGRKREGKRPIKIVVSLPRRGSSISSEKRGRRKKGEGERELTGHCLWGREKKERKERGWLEKPGRAPYLQHLM